MAYKKYTGTIPEIEVPAEGTINTTNYYVGLEKQDENLEFNNNLDNDTIQNTFIEWCEVLYERIDNTAKKIKLQTTTNEQEISRECIITFYNSDFPININDTKIKVIQKAAHYEYAYYNLNNIKITQNNIQDTSIISQDDININTEIYKFKFGKKEIQEWITDKTLYSLSGTLDDKNLNEYFTINYSGNNGEMILQLKKLTYWNFNKNSWNGQIICNFNNNQYILNLLLKTKQQITTVFYLKMNETNNNNITTGKVKLYKNMEADSFKEVNLILGITHNNIYNFIFYDETDAINPELIPNLYSYAMFPEGSITKTDFENITKIEIKKPNAINYQTIVNITSSSDSIYNYIIGSLNSIYDKTIFNEVGYLINSDILL